LLLWINCAAHLAGGGERLDQVDDRLPLLVPVTPPRCDRALMAAAAWGM
jgi:hypothetical protein